MFREIIKYRDLLFMLTLRDIRIRYKQAAMGFLWALFMPIMAVFAGIALTAFLIFTQIGVSIYLLWLPVLLIFLVLFTAGLGMFLSSANLFYRDIKYVVEIILMFGIFFTPVFYDANMFGDWQTLLLINPVGSILEAINAIVILHRTPDTFWLVYAGVASLAVFIFGTAVFHKTEPLFAENI